MSPNAAVVKTRLATSENAIIAAEKIPKLVNKPIGESAMTLNPAMSEAALPMRANPQAPPIPIKASS